MNDRYDGYAGGDQYELVGYDEFGQPVYRQVPAQQNPQGYDPYGTQQHQQPQGYGYDPYATGAQRPHHTGQQPPVTSYDPYAPYGTPTTGGHDPYGQAATSGQQPRVAEQTAYIPQQAGPAGNGPGRPGDTVGRGAGDAAGRTDTFAQREPRGDRDYRTEQFAFVEEPDGDSEDVIDWLQFTENRTERREEARRRARSRIVALVVVLALAAVGGVGYLWYAGKLPGTSSGGTKSGTATPVGAQNRDVIVVHLHNTKGGGTSTALLVDNTTTKQGATVLLPNSLALTSDDGTTTTLAKSVADDGSAGTGDAIDSVLGTKVEGTWRLDTPYLNNLVELVGNIEVTTNADVPDPDAKKKGGAPLVHKGEEQTLNGKMAVAYATYRAPGESQDAQLERFGQVMEGVLRKMSSDPQAATVTVQTLAQILDPSLSDKDLGSFLAKLADQAKQGDYKTALLPVQSDGTVGEKATDTVVKSLLGGTVKSPQAGDAVRVGIKNATGAKSTAEKARVTLVNGGYTFIDAGSGTAQSTSQVVYADDGDKENAIEVAKTLGLPTGSVRKGKIANSADVSVVLGQDYKTSS
ncbi:LCP family protein [Streptomyces chiangmaiensis]|uniref:LytR C-terminal domain-containing protein n=1 Tax=Streptomyces chiangmaiensis TaxID=766497 RepID=A0ABU7FJF7_9ACTN|nr:LytR C-terminal domain-containing protein [Streptomyces chiangmaiensis]MED7824234.1 LytR C-terminal domain-containing protein [Streptomyces chiangmaiensis]